MTFDEWLESRPAWAHADLRRLRTFVRREAPHLSEAKKWGAWCFCGKGIVCGFIAFKNHMSFIFWRGDELRQFHDFLQPTENQALCGAKFTSTATLDLAKLREVLHAAIALDPAPKTKIAKRAPRPVVVPEELSAALKKKSHAKARKFFDSLPPSAQRDYCEWIAGAKREETSARRLETTLERLAAGQRMNDEYC